MQVAPVMLDVEQVHLAQLSGAAAALAGPLQLPPAPADAARCRLPPRAPPGLAPSESRFSSCAAGVLHCHITVTAGLERACTLFACACPPHIGAAWQLPSHVCKISTQDSLP